MSTSTPPTAPPAAKVAAPRKPRVPGAPPKSVVRTLSAGKDQLQFLASVKQDGSWASYVLNRVRDAAGKTTSLTRGGSAQHKDMAAAKAASEAFVKQAKTEGWVERIVGGGGFKSKPDAFSLSNLPKPRKA